MENRTASQECLQPRSSLRALVQGLGIQLPADPIPQKHRKSVSSISIVVKPRPASPASPKRVAVRPLTSVPRALSPRALSPRATSPNPGGRTGSPKSGLRYQSPRAGSPRTLSPRAMSPRKSGIASNLHRYEGIRTGSPRPGSPTILRSTRANSPRPNSPRQSSPRARSPFSRTLTSQRPSSPRLSKPPASPRYSLNSKGETAGKKTTARTKGKSLSGTWTKPVKKVSFGGITPGKPQPLVGKKDEAPQPPPLSPQAIRELEASKAMVSPRIEFDSNRTPSPPPKLSDVKALKPILRPSKPHNGHLLTSLVTKVDTSTDPNDVGKSKAEMITRKHLYQTFRGLKMARGLPMADLLQIQAKRVVLMKPPGKYRRKTAIFDLDETLVHCLDHNETSPPDVVLPIRFPNGEIVHVSYTQANMKIRPYCTECLTQVSEDMELIVFTASQRSYADAVMNYIDPTRTLIHHRLYRENCVVTERIHIKDLRILANRSLKDVVLIDNAAYSFGYQIDNGIPIISWHDDTQDKELLYLTQYLKSLLHVEDVREMNQATFHLSTFYSDYSEEFLGKEKSRLK